MAVTDESTTSRTQIAVRRSLLSALGWDSVDPAVSVFSLGLTSVQAAALMDTIQDALGVTVEEKVLWQYPSVDELSIFIARTLDACDVKYLASHKCGISTSREPGALMEWCDGHAILENSIGTYSIRCARPSDAGKLALLGTSACVAPLSGPSEYEVAARISCFPLGQLVLFQGAGDVVASLHTQRIASIDLLSAGAVIAAAHSLNTFRTSAHPNGPGLPQVQPSATH